MPTTIQATGQVNAQMPAMPGRQVRAVLMNVATPTRITHIGHAWLHDQPDVCWTRKITPIPMSHVAPVMEPLARRGHDERAVPVTRTLRSDRG